MTLADIDQDLYLKGELKTLVGFLLKRYSTEANSSIETLLRNYLQEYFALMVKCSSNPEKLFIKIQQFSKECNVFDEQWMDQLNIEILKLVLEQAHSLIQQAHLTDLDKDISLKSQLEMFSHCLCKRQSIFIEMPKQIVSLEIYLREHFLMQAKACQDPHALVEVLEKVIVQSNNQWSLPLKNNVLGSLIDHYANRAQQIEDLASSWDLLLVCSKLMKLRTRQFLGPVDVRLWEKICETFQQCEQKGPYPETSEKVKNPIIHLANIWLSTWQQIDWKGKDTVAFNLWMKISEKWMGSVENAHSNLYNDKAKLSALALLFTESERDVVFFQLAQKAVKETLQSKWVDVSKKLWTSIKKTMELDYLKWDEETAFYICWPLISEMASAFPGLKSKLFSWEEFEEWIFPPEAKFILNMITPKDFCDYLINLFDNFQHAEIFMPSFKLFLKERLEDKTNENLKKDWLKIGYELINRLTPLKAFKNDENLKSLQLLCDQHLLKLFEKQFNFSGRVSAEQFADSQLLYVDFFDLFAFNSPQQVRATQLIINALLKSLKTGAITEVDEKTSDFLHWCFWLDKSSPKYPRKLSHATNITLKLFETLLREKNPYDLFSKVVESLSAFSQCKEGATLSKHYESVFFGYIEALGQVGEILILDNPGNLVIIDLGVKLFAASFDLFTKGLQHSEKSVSGYILDTQELFRLHLVYHKRFQKILTSHNAMTHDQLQSCLEDAADLICVTCKEAESSQDGMAALQAVQTTLNMMIDVSKIENFSDCLIEPLSALGKALLKFKDHPKVKELSLCQFVFSLYALKGNTEEAAEEFLSIILSKKEILQKLAPHKPISQAFFRVAERRFAPFPKLKAAFKWHFRKK